MKRYFHLWLAQLRYSIVREMMFKANFLLWILVEISWFVLQLCFVQVLYFNVTEIGGWTQWQMVLLVATSQLIQQVFQALFMVNCLQLPEMVRTGKLDFFLAQPVNPQFLISTRQFDLGAVVNGLLAAALCGYAAWRSAIPWSLTGVVAYLLLVALGALVHYAFMLAMMSLAFWWTRADGLMTAYYQFFQNARVPREVFHGPLKWILTWGIPVLLVANVPAKILVEGPQLGLMAALALMTAVMLGLSSWFFRIGLRRYGSASS